MANNTTTLTTNAPKTSLAPVKGIFSTAVDTIQSGGGAYAKCSLKAEVSNVPFVAKAAKVTEFEHGKRFELVGVAEHKGKKYSVIALIPAHIQEDDANELEAKVEAGETISINTFARTFTREDGTEQPYFAAELDI